MTEFLRHVVQFVMQFGFSPTVRRWRSLERYSLELRLTAQTYLHQ